MSRVMLQAIVEAAGLTVPEGFKSDHLLERSHVIHEVSDSGESGTDSEPADDSLDDSAEARQGGREIIPVARKDAQPDPIREVVGGRSSAVLLVPNPRSATLEHGHAAAVTEAMTPSAVALQDSAACRALSRASTVILPGSYNPLHRGHVRLLDAARALHREIRWKEAAVSDKDPEDVVVHAVFELSITNADKGGLGEEEVRARALQFSDSRGVGWPAPVVLTRAPLFSQKVSTLERRSRYRNGHSIPLSPAVTRSCSEAAVYLTGEWVGPGK